MLKACDYKLSVIPLVAILAMSWHPCAWALTIGTNGELGGVILTPSISTQFRYDTNILSDENQPISSIVSVLQASLQAKYRSLNARYQARKGNFLSSAADNYFDHGIETNVGVGVSENIAATFGVAYQRGHDERGTGFSQGVGDVLLEPDFYGVFNRNGKITFGSDDSMFNIELLTEIVSRDYMNNLAVNGDRSHDMTNTGVVLLRNLSVKTTMLAEFSQNSVVYTSARSSLDSIQQNYFFGVRWKYSVLSTGLFKAGWHTRGFIDDSKESYASWGWLLQMSWSPSIMSTLILDSASKTVETSGAGDYTLMRQFGVKLHQRVFGHYMLVLKSQFTLNSYLPGTARDGTVDSSAGIDIRIFRWLSVGPAYGYLLRKANRPGLSANRSVPMLHLQIHFD